MIINIDPVIVAMLGVLKFVNIYIYNIWHYS
jgi:hypothetical protein